MVTHDPLEVGFYVRIVVFLRLVCNLLSGLSDAFVELKPHKSLALKR